MRAIAHEALEGSSMMKDEGEEREGEEEGTGGTEGASAWASLPLSEGIGIEIGRDTFLKSGNRIFENEGREDRDERDEGKGRELPGADVCSNESSK
jgi:hypothetical protein